MRAFPVPGARSFSRIARRTALIRGALAVALVVLVLGIAAAALDVSLATVKRMLQRAEAHVQKRAKDDDLLSDWTGGDDE